MKMMAIFGFMVGMILLAAVLVFEPYQRLDAKAEARALSFLIYRNAVNEFVQKRRTPGIVEYSSLDLPDGLAGMSQWRNQALLNEAGELHCFVYGPAGAGDIAAALRLMRGSLAIGWNDNGRLARDGTPFALPEFIPHGNLVSVISIN